MFRAGSPGTLWSHRRRYTGTRMDRRAQCSARQLAKLRLSHAAGGSGGDEDGKVGPRNAGVCVILIFTGSPLHFLRSLFLIDF